MAPGGSEIAIVSRVRTRSWSVFPVAICLAILLLAAAPLAARTDEPAKEESAAPPAPQQSAESPAAAATPADRNGPSDRVELEAFIDGLMAIQLKDKHIAGATVSVVVDGKPLFAKGYGYADVAAKTPVSAEETMFRIGSVSKLFTWTAVMQLAEQGKLDLDADVNIYLKDFKLPSTYPQPVTLKHLLAHTAGFEDHVLGLFAHEASDLEPLGVVLAREMPSRVRPAGELASYSNHGTALAGHIVSQVSGMPWEDYLEQHLLQPLAMTHTLLRQPPQEELPATMSKGYKFVNGKYEEQGFEYVSIPPAGSFSSSAEDMSHFLIAHLQDGRYGDVQILKPETARQMRELLFTHDPTLSGMAYGFMRMSYNGQKIIEHGGDTGWFHSHFVMLPADKTGYFISYNTESAGGVRSQVLEAFLDRYYPAADEPPVQPAAELHDSLARYAGSYGAIRHSYTTVTKLGALMAVIRVSADGDELVLHGGPGGRRYVEVEPRVFREVDGQTSLAFREDAGGRIAYLFHSSSPAVALERLPMLETPRFNAALLVICVALWASALIGWPVVAFVTREQRHSAAAASSDQKTTTRADGARFKGAPLTSCIGWLTSLVALGLLSLSMIPFAKAEEFGYGVPAFFAALLWMTPVVMGLTVVMMLAAAIAWFKGYWRFSGRLHYTCVALGSVAFVWFLSHWNLLYFGA